MVFALAANDATSPSLCEAVEPLGREESVYAATCDRPGHLPVVTQGAALTRSGADDTAVLASFGLEIGTVDDSEYGIEAARLRRNHLVAMPTLEIREIAAPITIAGRPAGAFHLGVRPTGLQAQNAEGE